MLLRDEQTRPTARFVPFVFRENRPCEEKTQWDPAATRSARRGVKANAVTGRVSVTAAVLCLRGHTGQRRTVAVRRPRSAQYLGRPLEVADGRPIIGVAVLHDVRCTGAVGSSRASCGRGGMPLEASTERHLFCVICLDLFAYALRSQQTEMNKRNSVSTVSTRNNRRHYA